MKKEKKDELLRIANDLLGTYFKIARERTILATKIEIPRG